MWELPRDQLIPFIFAVIMTIVIASMDWQSTLAKKSGDTQVDVKEKWVIGPSLSSQSKGYNLFHSFTFMTKPPI